MRCVATQRLVRLSPAPLIHRQRVLEKRGTSLRPQYILQYILDPNIFYKLRLLRSAVGQAQID